MRSLRRRTSLTFKRPSEGYLDRTTRKWVIPSPSDVEAIGNLQPFRSGAGQTVLPDGLTQNDALVYFTETPLQSSSQFTKVNADYVEVDGLEFEVFFVENWTRASMNLDHYKATLIRRDKSPSGES